MQLRLLQTVVEVAGEKNSTLVMPVPVELLRFFDKMTPPAPAGEPKSAADSASLADFGNEDVATEEAEIESGAPLEIPEVPPIPTLPTQVGNGKLAAAAVPPAQAARRRRGPGRIGSAPLIGGRRRGDHCLPSLRFPVVRCCCWPSPVSMVPAAWTRVPVNPQQLLGVHASQDV